MTSDKEWTVEFYREENGEQPVLDFVRSFNKSDRIRIGQHIEALRILNITARAPLVEPIEGKLWELRIKIDRNAYRMLYFLCTGNIVVFLHGFHKKTRKTPKREIDVAMRRLKIRLSRIGEANER